MKKLFTLLAFTFAFTTAQAASITETLIANGNFKTLVTALKLTGLDETLKGTGPFTVFAPNDEAFRKLPKEKLDALLKDKAALTKVLNCHVINQKILSTDLKTEKVKTLEGSTISIKLDDGKVKVDKAHVTKADIIADNGVVHEINRVLTFK
jgi:uncharacterized surface protein with fasciclin (FAS1) repeats